MCAAITIIHSGFFLVPISLEYKIDFSIFSISVSIDAKSDVLPALINV